MSTPQPGILAPLPPLARCLTFQLSPDGDPSLALAHYNRGLAHLYLNQPAEMLVCFERVIELEPSNGAGQYHLAVALHAVGRTPEAHARLTIAANLGHSPEPKFIKAVQKALERIEGGQAAKAESKTKPEANN